MNKILLTYLLLFLLYSCANETIYSGKILNKENFDNINFENKENLINKLGHPSYIDPITSNFYYFSQKEEKKSIFNTNIEYSLLFAFKFDENDKILETKVYNLKNKLDISNIEEETQNNLIDRGLLEKIFGGVGPRRELTNSP